MDLDYMKQWIMMLALITLIGAAVGLVLDAFQDDIEALDTSTITNESVTISTGIGVLAHDNLYASASACRNTSGVAIPLASNFCNVTSTGAVRATPANFSDNTVEIDYTIYTPTHQRNITVEGLQGSLNATSYLGTMGTIVGVAILIVLVVGAFYLVRR